MHFIKETDTSIFTKIQIEEWFNLFVDEPLLSYHIIPRGYENTSIIIKSSAKSYVLRHSCIPRNHPEIDEVQKNIELELKYISFLRNLGYPVPTMYKPQKNSNEYFVLQSKTKEIYLVLMELIPGTHERYRYPMLKKVAKLLANLHKDSLAFSAQVVSDDQYSAFSFRMINFDEKSLENKIYTDLCKEYLLSYKLTKLNLESFYEHEQKMMIHNDLKSDNLFFNKNTISGIIDFGDSRVSVKEEDLGCFIWDMCDKLSRENREFKGFVKAFIKEYKRWNPGFSLNNAKVAIDYALDRYLIINLHYLRVNQSDEIMIKYQVNKATNQLKIIKELTALRDSLKL